MSSGFLHRIEVRYLKETLIDIETYSEVDIGKCGLYRYATDPSFEILLVAWATDEGEGFGETRCADLASGEPLPKELLEDFQSGNVRLIAHNASFERVCFSVHLQRHLPGQYLKPGEFLSPDSWICTMVMAASLTLPMALVSEMLKAIAEYAKHDRAEFVRVVQEAQSSQQTAEVKKQRIRLATAKQRVSELEVLLCKIYEDNILGKLSDSRYATLDAQYEKEQTELTAEISVLEKAIKSYEKHEKDADRFIALIDKYENFDKLTIAMLNEFIEKILVHERDRKGSIQTTQEVEIYFNFVGRFVPPAFGEVELTPEELEEIRKREERKDRLHQNYLKRKASGAQKRYEDKIKERKKAEIEAKKAAIRAEDIAKGVFVPVSSLPQREPMKGVQSA